MPSATAPLVDAADIRGLVGAAAYERARPYSRNGAVTELLWDTESDRVTSTVSGTSSRPYHCTVQLTPARAGYWRPTANHCSCPVGVDCKHVAATLLAGNAENIADNDRLAPPARRPETREPAWKTALGLGDAQAAPYDRSSTAAAPLALQFELRESTRRSRGKWQRTSTITVPATPGASSEVKLAARPVVRSKTGRWVTSNVGWGSLNYQVNRLNLDEAQVRWFGQFSAVSKGVHGVYLGQDPDRIILNDFASPLLWHLFDEAARLGIELVGAKNDAGIVIAHRAEISLDASGPNKSQRNSQGDGQRAEQGNGLHLRTIVLFDDRAVDARAVGVLGDHGLFHIDWSTGKPVLFLAPTPSPLSAHERAALSNPTLTVPASDVPEFLGEYYPTLGQSIRITSADASVQFPELLPPVLVLTARYQPDDNLQLDWQWEYRYGDNVSRKPLTGAGSTARNTPGNAGNATANESGVAAGYRDTASEQAILDDFDALPIDTPPLTATVLHGIEAAEFTVHVLPAIHAAEGIRVDVVGDKPDYRELTGTPKLTVSTVETEQRDWFDLGVLVKIDGKSIPFGPLFEALALGKPKLKLIDNSYLSLKQPVFDQLRELIAEAESLAEWETGPRINRYQAALWAEFEDLADETEQAVSWRTAVGGLLELTSADAADSTLQPSEPLPATVHAELRPYQLDGYAWLIFLWQHGLGGILADDMGLGKTLQTLALIARTRDSVVPEHTVPALVEGRGTSTNAATRRRAPFLVVAPTSVVSNWASEAARFTPDLAVTAITQTQAKSGTPLNQTWAGADVVITSYTLFRLDFDTYQEQQWAGLILDEAQFVKNHQSRAHRCAVELNAPFKLAVTGTPMENNLMELWSLLAIVAPGLFPSSRRFTEEYLRPVQHEKTRGDAAVVIDRLRRRIRPLMMRRTKELVAPELPAKQEQVLKVELAPKHRKLYDTFLQRERRKLLGLLDDLDKNRFIVFRSLTLLRMLSLDASLIDDEYAGVPSSKLDALFEQLDDVLAEGHRALIFSQFTSYLHKVAERFDAQGVEYVYLDGSTRRRASVIKQFKDGSAPVFLISLKAGGFGLNLTEADYVFLLDPWWNPATESQAVDRTHRIGQNKNVMVYRLVATDTIEEKVMALKERKSRLFDAVLDDDAVFSSSLTADDIRGLLDG